jgi:hypothetical protein
VPAWIAIEIAKVRHLRFDLAIQLQPILARQPRPHIGIIARKPRKLLIMLLQVRHDRVECRALGDVEQLAPV